MSEQKPREFQLHIGSYLTISGRPVENHNESILVREVDPAYDAAVQGLAEALRKTLLWVECISIKVNDREAINWRDINASRDALAEFEKVKK